MTSLTGRRVLIPRPIGRGDELAALLTQHGAVPLLVPLIRTTAPTDPTTLDRALRDLAGGRYRWVALTSVTGVRAVVERAMVLNLAPVVPTDTAVAAVGTATAAALEAAGLTVTLVPTAAGSAAELAAGWPPATSGQDEVLLPVSAIASTVLETALTALGYRVNRVTAYGTEPQPVPAAVLAELSAGEVDCVVFTSPSTVAAFDAAPMAARTALVAIGPVTADALRSRGHHVHAVAEQPTAAGLLAALQQTLPDPGQPS